MSDKTCPSCGMTKPMTDYHRNRARPSGYVSRCKTCELEKGGGRRHRRAYKAKIRYGLSLEEYEARMTGALCAVCGEPGTCLDHDHATGELREVLCRACNSALGQAGDSVERLLALAAYLRRHG